ncbi:MAG: hypothetical protein MI674_07300 [Cytophagales bacterium]|nr:hypothetical protein [Cytophagales bacterium]
MSFKIKTLLLVLLAITSCETEEKEEIPADEALRSVVIELAKEDNNVDRNAHYALCIIRDDTISSNDKVVAKMLEEISSIFARRPSNQTLFQRSFDEALVSGDTSRVGALLKVGAQELSDEEKLHANVVLDNRRAIKSMLKDTESDDMKLLGNAALGRVDEVRGLLTSGTPVRSRATIRTAWWYAVRNKHAEVAKLLLKTGKLASHEALVANALAGDATQVRNILEDKAILLSKGDITVAWYMARKNDYLQVAKMIDEYR